MGLGISNEKYSDNRCRWSLIETALIIQQINELELTWNLIGFIDDNKNSWGKVINGYSVIGGIDSLEVLPADTYIIIAIANYEIKKNSKIK